MNAEPTAYITILKTSTVRPKIVTSYTYGSGVGLAVGENVGAPYLRTTTLLYLDIAGFGCKVTTNNGVAPIYNVAYLCNDAAKLPL